MLPEQHHRPARAHRPASQLAAGLLIAALGIVLILDNRGVLEAERLLRYWPAVLVAVGAIKLWHAREGMGGSFAGLVFIAVGSWLLLEDAAWIQISFRDMWPALLVVIGLFVAWQALTARPRRDTGDANAVVSAMAILGGVARGNNSPAFRGGELTAIMGGCQLDLRHASIDGDAVLDVFAMWGGIEIRVPDDWTVMPRVNAILGGVDDKTRPPQGSERHRLVVRGLVIMAGVEIKN